MKQIILTALFAVLMLSVYGCADDGEKNGSTSSGNTGAGNIGTDTNPIDLNTYNCVLNGSGGYKLTNTQIDSEIGKKYPNNMDVLFYDNKDTWGALTKKYNIYYDGDDSGKYVIVKDTALTGVLKDYFYFFNTDMTIFSKYTECQGVSKPGDITPACINAINNAGYLDKLAYTVDMDKLKTNCSK